MAGGFVRGLNINMGMRIRTSIGKGIKGFRLMDGAGGETIRSLVENDTSNMDRNIDDIIDLVSDITDDIVFKYEGTPECFNDRSYRYIKKLTTLVVNNLRKNNKDVDNIKHYQKYDYVVAEIFVSMVEKYGYYEDKKDIIKYMIQHFKERGSKYYQFLKNIVDIFKKNIPDNSTRECIRNISSALDEIEVINRKFKRFFTVKTKNDLCNKAILTISNESNEYCSSAYIQAHLQFFIDVFINEKEYYKYELSTLDVQKIVYSKDKHKTALKVMLEKWARKYKENELADALYQLEIMLHNEEEQIPERRVLLEAIQEIKNKSLIKTKKKTKKK